jgi:PAS domain S-box-containing protein
VNKLNYMWKAIADGTDEERTRRRWIAFSLVAAGLAFAIGVTVVLGWLFDIRILRCFMSSWVEVNPLLAVGIITSSLSVLASVIPIPRRFRWRSWPVNLLGSLTLVLGIILIVSEWRFTWVGKAAGVSISNSLHLIVKALAILLIDVSTAKGRRPAQWLAMASAILPLQLIFAFVLGFEAFAGNDSLPGPIRMSVPVAVAWVCLSLGILCARPRAGFMSVITYPAVVGPNVRRLLLASIVLPALLAFALLKAAEAQLMNPGVGASILVVVSLCTWAFLIIKNGSDAKQAQLAMFESERQFRLLANALPQLVWMTRADGWPDYYNERWYEFTGVDRNARGDGSWLPALHPDDQLRAREAWYSAVATGVPYEVEYRMRGKLTNGYHWFLARALPIRNDRGAIVRWFGSCTDIDKQKLAEERAFKLTEKLTRTNHELEQFSYIVSHDLKEPLRTIITYLQLFVRKQGGEVDSDQNTLLQVVVDAARRMSSLIDGLLEYSRAENTPVEMRDVDLNDAVRMAVRNLSGVISEKKAEIISGDLPSLKADSMQMQQLFQNLIGNAIKFGNQSEPPYVEIHSADNGAFVELSIKDNGIGFDPRHAEGIFKIFRRAHPRDKFPGSGIGLSVCQRIVERHNGRIWADSRPGEGSTFHFTLPRAQ